MCDRTDYKALSLSLYLSLRRGVGGVASGRTGQLYRHSFRPFLPHPSYTDSHDGRKGGQDEGGTWERRRRRRRTEVGGLSSLAEIDDELK